ncbi:hypothetical protein [Sphingomonas xinjiangensis]|uniref:Inner membrane protein n=1 Tax=Sphingomonas xinjiangensis TaxID=643568 RepID=A0A840YE96_9SPHN|nr:hypothetical protein [Sphingomonas xinjiangensis]MBB5711164.1 hypothetical protein [Sphingomonas xinjiangensis]
MNDEPFAPEAAPISSGRRSNLLIGGIAFLGGIAATAGVLHLTGQDGGVGPQPAPTIAVPSQPVAVKVPVPPGTDLATLNAREQDLASRLDQLENRLNDVGTSARTASSYAGQAERLMIAFSVRRAIERGTPLGGLELQLRRRFAEEHGNAVSAITRAAAQPVTIEDLRLALDTIAPKLLTGPDDSLWTRAQRVLGDMVVLRQAGSPSPRGPERLRRAKRDLDMGRIEAALAEVAHLPGVATAESWVSAARRYVEARHALDEIERAAVQLPATPPPAAAPAAETVSPDAI